MNGADETTHLPASLQHFFKVVLGMEWPEGSEGGLKAISHAWSQFSDDVDAVLDELPSVAGQLDRSFDGVTASRILGFVRGDLAAGLGQLRDQAAAFEKQAKNAAADIQKNKIMLIVFAAMTLAAIIQLLSTLIGAVFIPVVQLAARITIQGILQLLKAKLGQLTVQQVGSQLWKLSSTIAKWAAGGAALMVGVDGGIQGGQIAAGDRDGWDTESLKGSAIGGAIGGAAAGVFHGVARGAGNFFSKEIRHQLPRGWQKTFDLAGPSAYALGQVAMVAFSNPVVFIALKDDKGVMWEGVLGALSGPGGNGRGGGVTGPDAMVLGQSFLDNLERLGLGWLKPAAETGKPETVSGEGGQERGVELPPPYDEAAGEPPPHVEKPDKLVIPQAVSTPETGVSGKDGSAGTVRDISSRNGPMGTVFGSEAPARQVIPTESAPTLREFLAGDEKSAVSEGRQERTADSSRTSVAPDGQSITAVTGQATAEARGEPATASSDRQVDSGQRPVSGEVKAGGGFRGDADPAMSGRQQTADTARPSTESGDLSSGVANTQLPTHGQGQSPAPAHGQSQDPPQVQAPVEGQSQLQSQSQGQAQPQTQTQPQPQTQTKAQTQPQTQAQTQPGASSRVESTASARQPESPVQPVRSEVLSEGRPQTQSRPGGEVSSPMRTPDQQAPSSSQRTAPDRVAAKASGIVPPSDRAVTTADGARHSRPESPLNRSGTGGEQPTAAKPAAPLSSREGARPAPEATMPRTVSGTRPATSEAVLSPEPTRPSTSDPETSRYPVRPAAAAEVATAGPVGSVGDPVSLVDVVGGVGVGLSDVDFVSLRDGGGGVVGVFFPLVVGESEVVVSAFERGAGVPGAYSVVGHGGGGFSVRRRSDGVRVRLDEVGVYRLLSSRELPGGRAWRGSPELVVLSCRVADPVAGDLLGGLRKLLRDKDYHGDVTGPSGQARVSEDGRVEYLDTESQVASGRPARFVDLATPEAALIPLPEATGPEPARGISRPEIPRVVSAWSGWISITNPLQLSEAQEAELSAFAARFAANVKVLVAQNREMPDVRLYVHDTVNRHAAYGQAQHWLLEERLRAALRKEGMSARGLGITFDRHLQGPTRGKELVISIVESPNRSAQSYRATRELNLPFNQANVIEQAYHADVLPSAAVRRLRWLVEGLVRRVGDNQDPSVPPVLTLRLVTAPTMEETRRSGVIAKVNDAVRMALSGASEEAIRQFIDKHIELSVLVRPGRPSILALDIAGPQHALDRTPAEPRLMLPWGDEAQATEPQAAVPEAGPSAVGPAGGVVPLPPATGAPIWFEGSGRAPDAAPVAMWFAAVTHSVPPNMAETGRNALHGFLDVLARNVKLLELNGREPLDIRLEVNLPVAERAMYAAGFFATMENDLRTGLAQRGVPPRAMTFAFDHLENDHRGEKRRGVGIVVHHSANQPAWGYQAARSLDLALSPRGQVLPVAVRRRLGWMLEGLATRVKDNDDPVRRPRLIIDLRASAPLLRRQAEVIEHEVNAAVRAVLRGAPEAEISRFIGEHIEFRRARGDKVTGLFLDLEGPEHPLDRVSGARELKLSWSAEGERASTVDRRETVAPPVEAAIPLPVVQAALRPSPVVGVPDPVAEVSWRAELPMSGPVRLSPRDEASLDELVERIARNTVELGRSGREPLDIRLRVTDTVERRAAVFEMLEERLRAALRARGVDADAVWFAFDRLDTGPHDGEAPSAEVSVRRSPNRPVREYRAARNLTLPFLPNSVAFSQASWRRLGWLIEGFARRADDSDEPGRRPRLVLQLGSAPEMLSMRTTAVTIQVEAAVRAALPWASDERIGRFVEEHIEFRHEPSSGDPVLTLEVEGPVHALDLTQAEHPAALSWTDPAPGITEPPAPNPAGTPGPLPPPEPPDRLFPLPPAQGPVLRTKFNVHKVGLDAPAEYSWSAVLSATGPPRLSAVDRRALDELADRLVRDGKIPTPGHETWDVRVHVTTKYGRSPQYGHTLFDLTKEALRSALRDRGVDPEVLRLDLDHLSHRATKGKPEGVGITVHRSPDLSEESYRNARSLDLPFLPRNAALSLASRRRLGWLVDGLVRRAEQSNDQSRLVLDLRSKDSMIEDRVRTITAEVNEAVRAALPGASDERVKAFIDDRIEFRQVSSNKYNPVLFIDVTEPAPVVETPVGETRADELIPLPAARNAIRPAAIARVRDAVVLVGWRAELSATETPRLSPEDDIALGELASRIALNTVELERSGREPVDVRMTLTDTPERRRQFGPELFAKLEDALRGALRAQGIDADAARFSFDRLESTVTTDASPSLEVTVHRSSNRTVRSYQAARDLQIPFLPRTAEFSQAARRRLGWMVEGLAERVRDNTDPGERPRLVLDLRSSPRMTEPRMGEVTVQLNAAVRKALPGASRETIEQFIENHIEIRSEPSDRNAVLYLDIQGPEHALDRLPTQPRLQVKWTDAAVVSAGAVYSLPPAAGTSSWPPMPGARAGLDPVADHSWFAAVETDPPRLSPEDQASLRELADRIARDSRDLNLSQREPLDVRLHVTDAPDRRERLAAVLFEMLEDALRTALEQRGVAPEVMRLVFDHLEHDLRKDKPRGAGITVHRSPNLSVRSYQTGKKLILPFLPRNPELSQASRRRLGWMVEGLVERIRDNTDPNERPQLILELRTPPMMGTLRAEVVAAQVTAAVRSALPAASEAQVKQFIEDHIGFRQRHSERKPVLLLEIEAPEHPMDATPVETELAASLIPLPAVVDVPSRPPMTDDHAGAAPGVVAVWQAGLTTTHPSRLSHWDETSLDGFAAQIARNSVELERHNLEPLDVKLTVTDTAARWREHGPALIELVKTRLRAALPDGGTVGPLEVEVNEGEPPSAGLVVYRSPNRSRLSYQAARNLDLTFSSLGAELPRASRRRLEWMVEGLAQRVRDSTDAAQRVRLVLELRSTKRDVVALERPVTTAVNEAVRAALPSASEEQIRQFIEDHIGVRRVVTATGAPALRLDIEGPDHPLDLTPADPEPQLYWSESNPVVDTTRSGITGLFHTVNEEGAQLFTGDEWKFRTFGTWLGEKIVGQEPDVELPDVRFTVRLQRGSGDTSLQTKVREYLLGLVQEGMREGGMSPAAAQNFTFTWSWAKDAGGYDGLVSVRSQGTPGRIPEHYRQARALIDSFLSSRTQLPVAVERRLTWALEGFFGRFAAAAAERPSLFFDLTGSQAVAAERLKAFEELTSKVLTELWNARGRRSGVPPVEQIMREHVRMEWRPTLKLPHKHSFALRETVQGEAGGPVDDVLPEATAPAAARPAQASNAPEEVVEVDSPESTAVTPVDESGDVIMSDAGEPPIDHDWLGAAWENARTAPWEESTLFPAQPVFTTPSPLRWPEQGEGSGDRPSVDDIDPETFASMGFDPADFAYLGDTPDSVTLDRPVGSVGDPVSLVDVVGGVGVGLSDVDFVSLRDGGGGVVGVFFPLVVGESEVVVSAFERGAGVPGAYSVVGHGGGGFSVRRRSDGVRVRLDEVGVYRLLSSRELPGGRAWRGSPELVVLSCRVADPVAGDLLGGLRKLLRDKDYHGDVSGPATPVEILRDGTVRVPDSASSPKDSVRLADYRSLPDVDQDAQMFTEDVLAAIDGRPAPEIRAESETSSLADSERVTDEPPTLPEIESEAARFIEELFDELDEQVSTATPPVRLRQNSWVSLQSAHSDFVSEAVLETQYGIPRQDQRRFQKMADRFGVVFDVRPANPASVGWRARGAVPKPLELKAKTLNELDVHLGMRRERIGLVAYFEPLRPDLANVPQDLRERVLKRYEDRSAEYTQLAESMRGLEESGRFRVVDGVVQERKGEGFRNVTGDNDVYDIRLPEDGSSLHEADYERMVYLLTGREMGVEHGALKYWEPETEFQRKIRDDIDEQHRIVPLVRFGPGLPPTLVHLGDDQSERRPSSMPTAAPAPRPNLTSAYRPEPVGTEHFESLRPWQAERRADGAFPAFGRPGTGTRTAYRPPLRAATDSTLGINGARSVDDGGGVLEAREFFATDEVLDRAREALRRTRTGIGLEVRDSRLVLDDHGRQQVLHRVVPRMPERLTDDSRGFAGIVHGATPDTLLFEAPGGRTATARVGTDDGTEVSGTFNLAEGLSEIVEHGDPSTVDTSRAAEIVARDRRDTGGSPDRPLPGHRYGRMLDHAPGVDQQRARLDEAARRMGVNQFAWAKPGQMYVRSSIPGEGADGRPDYTDRAGMRRPAGYHFATVIAESTDGRAQITLENRPHTTEQDAAVREAIERNLVHHHAELGNLSSELAKRMERARAAGDDAEVTRLGRHRELAEALSEIARTGYDRAEPSARHRAWQAMAAELDILPGPDRWFFRMYTREPGETFFDQQALSYAPDAKAPGLNPLVTTALGGLGEIPSAKVPFAPGRSTADRDALAGVRAVARDVARAAVLRGDLGLGPVKVRITGYGGNGFFPGSRGTTAQRRAGQVRDHFREVLAEELTALQGDNRTVGVRDVELSVETGRLPSDQASADRHRVTVEVAFDDAPNTPERQAATGYDRAVHGLPELELPRSELRARLAEYTALAGEGALEHHALPEGTRERLIALDRSLAALPEIGRARVRALVNEALLAASLVPTREQARPPKRSHGGVEVDRRAVQPVTPARLTQLLDELNVGIASGADPLTSGTSSLPGLVVPADAALPVRLAALGLVNLSVDARIALSADPLFTALSKNPAALTEALFAAAGNEEQYFLNTAATAAVDTSVRGRVPTLAGLLQVGGAVADATEHGLGQASAESRAEPDRPFGRTMEEMVRKRVAEARAEFSGLEQRALRLVGADQADRAVRREWRQLTARWARSMQKLAAAELNVDQVPVLTRNVLCDSRMSRMLVSPLIVDRGSRRRGRVDHKSYVERMRRRLAPDTDVTPVGSATAADGTRPDISLAEGLRTEDGRTAFWARVAETGGAVLSLPHHAVHVRATTVDGRRVFFLNDPKDAYPALLTPDEFVKWATSGHAYANAEFFPADTADDARAATTGSAASAGEPAAPDLGETSVPRVGTAQSDVVSISAHPRVGRRSSIASSVGEISPFDLRRTASEPELTRHRTSSRTSSRGRETPRSDSPETRWHGGRHLSPGRRFGGDDGLLQVPVRRSTGGYAGAFFPTHESSLETSALWRFPFDDLHTHLPETIQELPEDADSVVPDGERSEVDSLLPETAIPDDAEPADTALAVWSEPLLEVSDRVAERAEGALPSAVPVEQARVEAERLVRALPSVLSAVDEDTFQFLHDGLTSMVVDLIADGTTPEAAWEEARVARLRDELEALRGPVEEAHYTLSAEEIRGRAPEPEASPDSAAAAEQALDRWLAPIMEASGRLEDLEESAETAGAVEQARAEAEEWAGELPSGAGIVDEETRQTLHDGLVSMLTDLIAGGVSRADAWEDADVSRLREDLESLRGEAESAHYRRTALEMLEQHTMGKWERAIWDASARVEEREEGSVPSVVPVEQARAEAERLTGGLPSALPTADEWSRRTLHDGLVSILTEHIAGGVDPRVAWHRPDVVRLRGDLEMLRGPAESAHYTRTAMEILGPVRSGGANEAATGQVTEPAPTETRSKARRVWERWEERVGEAVERVRQREQAAPRAVASARQTVESLIGGLPRAAAGTDTTARQLVHDALSALLTELISAGASPRAAWDHPDVAPLRESAESLRELSSVRTHYTGVPLALTRLPASVTAATPAPPVVVEASGSGQGFQRSGTPSTELVGEDRSSPDSDEPVGDDDSTYSAEFLPIWTADRRYEADTRGPIEWLSEPHREDGSAPEPGRLSAAVAEFEAHLSLEHRPVSSFREEAAALLGDRPAPRVGYGPDAAEQQGLWRSMVDAVASALSRDANAEGLTSELRAGFERLRTFDDLAAWAETQLAQFRNRIDQARARLDERRQDALPGDQPPEGRERWQEQLRWREQLRRQEAEDLLGALPPTVPGGAPERIRRAFHEGITTMLTDLLLHEEHPTYAWTELGDVRQAAEAVRLSSRHLRDATPETPFGQFPEPGRGFYSEDLREEDLPTYDETQDSGATRHSDGAPGYTAHPVADEPPAYEDSMAEFDDGTQEVLPYQVEQMADLLTQLPRNEIVALRTRLLSLVLPPEGLTPDELARRFPLHDLMLSALAYHAFLDGDQPGAAGERAQMLALLDKPGIHDTLGAAARRRPVLDDAHHALRNMFTVARSYAETSSEPRSAPRPESTLTPDVDLSEVDFVPLRSRSGVVVGVGFPLSDQERGVLREAFENRAVVEGEFSVPLHHGENGFSVRARNGRIVSLDERAVVRLLSSVESPGDASWRQRSSLVFLSCWVSSPRYGNRIVALAELLHDAGLRGDVHGFDTRVEVRRDGTVRPLPDGAEPAEGSVVFAAPSDEPVQPLPGVVAGRRSDPVAVAEIRARLERMAEAAFTGGQREYHKMLGPDLFGLGRTPEAPQALRGLDYDELSAAEGMTLLQRLDMTKPFPEAETLTYDALAAAEQDVFVSDWTDKELQYWDSVGIQVSALPARRETPRLLHGIWLGGPLAADGTTGLFQQRFADSAKTLGGRAVLWTDVPRKRIEAAVRNESDASLADVREMVKWARENDIHLVNVDEVFNAEAPMRLDPFYRAELTKGTGRGYAAASDTLRVYIEARFGGLYMDGDDILHDPDVLLNVHESPEGYAFGGIRVGDSRVLSNNSPLAMAKGHPLAWLYLVQLEQNYDQTQLEIFPAMLATASKEFYATPQGRLRRNSVLQRTGPDTFFKLRERLGLKVLPLMSGIGLRSSQSWAPGSSTEPTRPRVTAEDIDGTALLTEKVVQSLIRQLRNRQGDLFLTDVADLVFQHTTPDVVWTAALEFLASVPALRKEVRTATVERFVNGSMTAISLPEEVAALLHRRAGAQLEFLGDALTPVTMSAPAGRGIEPAGPDWRTPIPSEVMTDFALDLLTRRTEGQRLSMKRRAEQMAAAPSAKRVRLPEEPVDSRDTTPESEVDGRAGGRGPGLRPGMPELLIEQKPGRTGLTAEQTLPADDPAPVPEAPRRSHDSDEDLSMEESGPPSKKRAISPQVSVLDGAPQALGAVIFSTGPGSPADLSGQVLQGLLDGLRDHPGHLDLAAVAALVEDSPEADEVWNTVIAFLAADPGLATQVRTVTLRSVDEAGVPRRVVLPPLAAEFLHLSEDPPTSPAPGEFTHRAELTRPAWLPLRREADPTTKEDHGHDD